MAPEQCVAIFFRDHLAPYKRAMYKEPSANAKSRIDAAVATQNTCTTSGGEGGGILHYALNHEGVAYREYTKWEACLPWPRPSSSQSPAPWWMSSKSESKAIRNTPKT